MNRHEMYIYMLGNIKHVIVHRTQALQCDDAIVVNIDSYMNEYHNNVTTLHTGEFNFIVMYEISQFCGFVGYVLLIS